MFIGFAFPAADPASSLAGEQRRDREAPCPLQETRNG